MDNLVIDDIDIEVIKKNIKNINLSVHPPDGRVRLSVPNRMNDDEIRRFAISKLGWIKKQRKKFKEQKRQFPKEFVSGESHHFMGNKYLLNVIETKSKQRVEINNKYINLYVRENSTKEKREKIMNEWYREYLKSTIPKYIEKWEKIMNVSVNKWGVKLMKTRWGSCNIRAKRIWLNLELAKKNPRCLEYVVVHEMVHLLERLHNNRFKAYMTKYLPNWKSIQNELNGLSHDNDRLEH